MGTFGHLLVVFLHTNCCIVFMYVSMDLSIDFTFRPSVMTHLLGPESHYLHGLPVLISLALNNLGSPVDGHELLSYKLSSYQCSSVKFPVSSN